MIGRFVSLASVCGVLGAIQWAYVQTPGRPDVAGFMLLAGLLLMYSRVRILPRYEQQEKSQAG